MGVAQNHVVSLRDTVGKASGSIIGSFSKIALAAGAVVLAIKGIQNAVVGPIKLAAELEATTVSFATLLGSADAAKGVLKDLQRFSASTPFAFREISDSAKALTAFGVGTDELIPSLTKIGDIAAGLGIPFEQLSEIYGKIKVQNTVFNNDLNQLQNKGIPIVGELAKEFGVSNDAIKKMASEGKISFKDIEKVFSNMTAEGSMFGGGMEALAGTLSGVWSTMKDNLNLVLTDIGTQIAEIFDLRSVVTGMTEGFQSARNLVGGFFEQVKAFLPVMNAFKNAWLEQLNLFKTIGSTVLGGLTAGFKRAFNIGDSIQSAVGWIEFLQSGFAKVTEFVIGIQPIVEQVFTVVGLYIKTAVDVVGTLISSLGSLGGKAISILPSFEQARDFILGALVTVEFGLRNLTNIWEMWRAKSILALLKVGDEIDYLTSSGLELLRWFADNWYEIFTDMFNMTVSIFKNIGKNIYNFFANIGGLISGTTSLSDIWTPLTDGFEATLKELPNIANREASELTKFMQKHVNDIQQELGESYLKFYDERMGELLAPPQLIEAIEKTEDEVKKILNSVPDDISKSIEDVAKTNPFSDIAEFGSQAARDTLLRFYGQTKNDPNKKLEDINNKQLNRLDAIAAKEPVQLVEVNF